MELDWELLMAGADIATNMPRPSGEWPCLKMLAEKDGVEAEEQFVALCIALIEKFTKATFHA